MVDEAKGGKMVAEKRLADATGKVREGKYSIHIYMSFLGPGSEEGMIIFSRFLRPC